MKYIARWKRRLLLETMWLVGGAGLRLGSGGPEGGTPSRLPAGIGATMFEAGIAVHVSALFSSLYPYSIDTRRRIFLSFLVQVLPGTSL